MANGELAEGADGVPAVDGHGVADQADGAERGDPDDPPEDLLDDGEGGGVEVQERLGRLAHLERGDADGDRDHQDLQDVEAHGGGGDAVGDGGAGAEAQEVLREQAGQEGPPVAGLAGVLRLRR